VDGKKHNHRPCTPTAEPFPYHGCEGDVQVLFLRVCRTMGERPSRSPLGTAGQQILELAGKSWAASGIIAGVPAWSRPSLESCWLAGCTTRVAIVQPVRSVVVLAASLLQQGKQAAPRRCI
jgi:hypothetical protein